MYIDMDIKYCNAKRVFRNIQLIEKTNNECVYYKLKDLIDSVNERIFIEYYLDSHIINNFGRYINLNVSLGKSVFYLNIYKTLVKNYPIFDIFDNQDSENCNYNSNYFKDYHELLYDIKEYVLELGKRYNYYNNLLYIIGKYNIEGLFIFPVNNIDKKQDIKYYVYDKCLEYLENNGINYIKNNDINIDDVFVCSKNTVSEESFLLYYV
jgi:hypothetical protein